MAVIVRVDLSKLGDWRATQEKLVLTAAKRAGVDALRAMRAEASRQIRTTKNLKVGAIGKRITTSVSKRDLSWTVRASGEAMPIGAFGGVRQVGTPGRAAQGARKKSSRRGGRGGVTVEINKGSRKFIPGAFIATMKSGHRGVFRREHRKTRLPINELFTTTVADAFRDAIPFIAARGQEVFTRAFQRNMRSKTGETREARGVWLPDAPSSSAGDA